MKKLIFSAVALLFVLFSIAQDTPVTKEPPVNKKGKKDWSKVNLGARANDHFMIQYGWAGWAGKPDSINTGGFSRSFNFYVMIDMPFKTDPRFSVAFGPGIGTDHIFFEKTNITIEDKANPLRFQDLKDTTHFNKYKLVSAYLEAPIELRFCLNPENSNKSFKVALGAKIGTLVDIHTKGKKWQTKLETAVPGFSDKYVVKKKEKHSFNGTRVAATMRIGYGNIGVYGVYQLGSMIKEGLGPQVKAYSIGLTISGL